MSKQLPKETAKIRFSANKVLFIELNNVEWLDYIPTFYSTKPGAWVELASAVKHGVETFEPPKLKVTILPTARKLQFKV
jgi:hypothetical protein